MKRAVYIVFLLVLAFFYANITASDKSKEERNLATFTDINISGAFTVEIIAGEDQDVIVEASKSKYLDLIITRVENGTLIVEMKRNDYNNIEAKLFLKMETLESLQTSGANKINIKNIDTERFRMSSSGAGNITMAGKAESALFDFSGATAFEGEDFKVGDISISASGASNVTVYASGSIEGEVSGVAKLNYYGNPSSVNIDNSGLSSVKKK